jgi:mRNA interferase HigB
LTVQGRAKIANFARKRAAARKPLRRFLSILQSAEWPHFIAVKESFPAADYAPATGTLIFDIGGNKYRLVARVDFTEELLYIHRVMTHDDYNRENL